MNLSKETIEVLQNFAEINNSLHFSKGSVIETMSFPASAQFAKAVVAEKFPQDFAIYDLKRFLSALSVFENPDLIFKENWVEITENSKTLKYIFAEPSIVQKARTINFPEAEINFVLPAAVLKEVLKARNILSLPNIVFLGEDGKIKFGAENPDNPTTDTYYTDMGETDHEFKAIYKVDNLRLLPGDYEVKISKRLISEFSSKNLKYWVALEDKSQF